MHLTGIMVFITHVWELKLYISGHHLYTSVWLVFFNLLGLIFGSVYLQDIVAADHTVVYSTVGT